MHGARLLSVLLAGATCLALIGMLTFIGLFVADWREVRHQRPTIVGQVMTVLDHGDRLHYVVHLTLGRLADLNPYTEAFAEDQYDRAVRHARTERQVALVTTDRPSTFRQRVLDTLGIVGSGFNWAGTAGRWAVSRAAPSA